MPRHGTGAWLHGRMQQRRGVLLALSAATLSGLSGVVAADAFEQVTPIQLAQFRNMVAAIVLGAVAYRRRQTATGGRLGGLALLGAVIAGVTLTYYWAIERLGVGPGVTVQFLGPVLALMWMRLVQHRPLGGDAWAAAALAVAGTALVAGATAASLDTIGVAAGLGAAVTLAAYLILGERLGRTLPGLTIGAYGFAVSALMLLVSTPIRLPVLDLVGWLELAWIAVPGTAVTFMLLLGALRLTDPGRVGVAATAEPVVAAAAAWVILGQSLAPSQVVGGAAVVIAVAIAGRSAAIR